MTTIFIILTIQIVLGAIDNLWHHELTEKLSARRSARLEIALHAMRESLYGIIFLCFAWVSMQGGWSWLLIGLFFVELLATLTDFVIEDKTRRLPSFERVLHTLLAINLGVFFAVFLPYAIAEAHKPTAVQWTSHGLWSIFFSVAAVLVFIWSVRNCIAACHWFRPAAWQRNPIQIGRALEQKHFLVTGATGFIGKALVKRLVNLGHHVTVVTRSTDKAWYLFGDHIDIVDDLGAFDINRQIDVIVNLAGAPIVGWLWTPKRKRELVTSRLATTDALIKLVSRLNRKPELMISTSAIGFYGVHGEKRLIEVDGPGNGFQSSLCVEWERAAEEIKTFGVRLVKLRLGLVLGKRGGMFPQLSLPWRFRINVTFGRGTHWMSWIHIDDVIGLILHAVDNEQMRGAVNATAPTPLKHRDFMDVFAKKAATAISVRIPTRLLRFGLGELSELFVDGQKVMPVVAQSLGYKFKYAKLGHAATALLAKDKIQKPKHIYFDGACPVCSKEIDGYKNSCDAADIPVEFENLDEVSLSLEEYGLPNNLARKRLYVKTANGEVLSGVDAFITIWHTLPRYHWLAKVAALPVIYSIFSLIYDLIAAPLVSSWSQRLRRGKEKTFQQAHS